MSATPHILIAHDHGAIRSLLVYMAGQIYPSALIRAVTNGAEALQAYSEHSADLVITNGQMPIMGGAELIRALRAQQAACPILLVSLDATIRSAALAAGANAFLQQPFDIADLRLVLTPLLPP